MCGITGWIDWEKDLTKTPQILEAMTKTMVCRGPDDQGLWLSPHAALGHRRLVVVDPAGGAQPMVRERGEETFVIVYNGELYNTEDIRRDLAVQGYAFRGYSDTEVLLLSYMEWGPECLSRLNGIFAFAIWDEARQRLFVARDRLGVKPLFFANRGSSFIFGSEPKAILANPLVKAEIDAEGLAEVFGLGPARTPGHGVYRGISELRPGFYLEVAKERQRINRYWRLESREHRDDLENTAAHVRYLLEDAVKRQLVSDVPVCVLLSGGLDSSAITAFAANHYRERGNAPLETWSIDYQGNEEHFHSNAFQPDADAPWVKRVSEEFHTIHHGVEIATDALVDALEASVRARDLPGMADVDASLYLFCREIKRKATVALSGESADEVFGGYPWFHRADRIEAETFPWATVRPRLLNPELREKVRPREYIADRYQETLAEVPRLPGDDALEARMREISYLNITWFLTTLLDRKDRMSMGHGLEVRVPYCDHRIVEYVWNIPWAMKACDGQAKGILRRALKGVLPDDVLARKKSPYPKTHNPAYLEAVRKRVKAIMDDPSSPILSVVNLPFVRSLIDGDIAVIDQPWFGQLMTGPQLFAYLIQVDYWLRAYNVDIVI